MFIKANYFHDFFPNQNPFREEPVKMLLQLLLLKHYLLSSKQFSYTNHLLSYCKLFMLLQKHLLSPSF